MSKDSLKDVKIDGSKIKITIVLPYFNEELGLKLLENCKETLTKNGVKDSNIRIVRVGGCLETPFACLKIAKNKKNDVIIALGIIVKGETKHFDLVAETTHQGLMQVQLEQQTPIIFGILACNNIKQAKDRCSKTGLNKGREIALSALIQSKL